MFLNPDQTTELLNITDAQRRWVVLSFGVFIQSEEGRSFDFEPLAKKLTEEGSGLRLSTTERDTCVRALEMSLEIARRQKNADFVEGYSAAQRAFGVEPGEFIDR